jgi:hypothetical protein
MLPIRSGDGFEEGTGSRAARLLGLAGLFEPLYFCPQRRDAKAELLDGKFIEQLPDQMDRRDRARRKDLIFILDHDFLDTEKPEISF